MPSYYIKIDIRLCCSRQNNQSDQQPFKWLGQKVAIFRHTAANFRQKRRGFSRFQFCPKIFTKWIFPTPNFVFLKEHSPTPLDHMTLEPRPFNCIADEFAGLVKTIDTKIALLSVDLVAAKARWWLMFCVSSFVQNYSQHRTVVYCLLLLHGRQTIKPMQWENLVCKL